MTTALNRQQKVLAWLPGLSARTGRSIADLKTKGLADFPFPKTQVSVEFPDGTRLAFRNAFYVQTMDDPDLVAVFTEQAGDFEVRLGTEGRVTEEADYASPANLRSLFDEAQAVCKAAIEQKAALAGPVNWADLRVIDACSIQSFSGETGYRVILSEADPSAWRLQAYVHKALADRGYPGVDVQTEW